MKFAKRAFTVHRRLLLALSAALAACFAGSVTAAEHTNVVIIYADDLGWGDLGCYGHQHFETPNIDRMAREGARLTQFYSCCPYCAPSRVALQTGRYPFRSGLVRNPVPAADPAANNPAGDKIGIPDTEITLGEAFQSAGYRTICIGKWHLGHQPKFRPLRHGYDEYLGILYSNDMHPVELFDGERMVEYPVVQATLTRRYTERAIQFIRNNRRRPFFVYLPHAMPHKPLAASEGFYNTSVAGLYADVIAELDWSVGRILATLAELELEKNTLVIFTSDNGPWYGGSTGALRGMKSRTWEGGIRVPLVARWPGQIPAGHVSHQPAIIMDLFVTSLRAAGVALPKDRVLDGRDILPLLTSDAPSPHEALYSMKGPQLCSIRSGKWKLHMVSPGPRQEKVWRPDEAWADKRRPDGVRIIAPYEQAHPSQFPGVMTGDPFDGPALFDLEKDAAEQYNVAIEHPDVVERLKKRYEEMVSEAKVNSP